VPEKLRATLKPAEVDAILELAFLATASDGLLRDEEIDAFVRTMMALLGPRSTPARVRGIIGKLERRLARGEQCLAARCAQVDHAAGVLRRKAVRELAYKLAYVMSLSDLQTNDAEFVFVEGLREALHIGEARASDLADEAAGAVIGDGRAHRPGTCVDPSRTSPLRRPIERRTTPRRPRR
jgi:hypothetical protein